MKQSMPCNALYRLKLPAQQKCYNITFLLSEKVSEAMLKNSVIHRICNITVCRFTTATKRILAFACYLFVSASALANEHAHIHGHGQLLIAQDGNHWQLAFRFPAEDLFGIEHPAHSHENDSETLTVISQLKANSAVFSIAGGECTTVKSDLELPDIHHSDQHEDINLTYWLTCSEPLRELTISVFDLTSSLNELEVQWVTANGQGRTELTPAIRELTL